MSKLIHSLSVIGLVTCFASQAVALDDKGCDSRDKLLKALAQKYDETVVSIAILDNGTILERTESPDHETFSLLISTPDGRKTCPLASGKGWNDIPVKKGPNL